ncbi:MurR/RpiR family transcriptional regulator [Streptomyces sp. NPDC047108]|uniref:MurR/RpiR family transcriptional regulator n=1 Tax=Streptomyces sp. NPDC047108 TaxID=3155025 RepID=UPI0033D75839
MASASQRAQRTKKPEQAPDTFDALVALLHERFATLTPSQRLLADRVMADPEGVAFMTVSELATAVGVNEATVVRFATGLGLGGYPGLTRLCRERLREQAQLLRRYDNLEQLGEEGGDLIERAVAQDRANISRTFARIDTASWDTAVRALAEAPRVHVLGLRKCHAPAYLLGYLLRMVREDVEIVAGGAGTLTDDLRRVRSGDAFVAVSIHRYTAETVRAFDWARARGARCIALTDNPGSPLAPLAAQAFFVDASGPSVLRSMTAFTSLVQALAAGVARVRGHEVRSTLLQEEELLEDFGVYTAEGSRGAPPAPDDATPESG